MQTINAHSRQRGQIDPRIPIAILVFAVIVIAAFWFLTREPAPEPVPAPQPTRPIETVEPAETAAERGDTARGIIEALEAADGGVDYAEAHRRAREFLASERNADAQLLYFFAARGGYGPAAFELATFYDPVGFDAATSLVEEADPFQAYRWYRAANEAGQQSAAARLEELKAWASAAADDGDAAAERLLLQWEDAT